MKLNWYNAILMFEFIQSVYFKIRNIYFSHF